MTRYRYVINQVPIKVITKRTTLANITQIYDPLGLLGPVIVTAKTTHTAALVIKDLLGRNCAYRYSHQMACLWDAVIYFKRLQNSSKGIAPPHLIKIHGFCDASINAYGACVYAYIRTSSNGRHTIQLLCAKSRVASVKRCQDWNYARLNSLLD